MTGSAIPFLERLYPGITEVQAIQTAIWTAKVIDSQAQIRYLRIMAIIPYLTFSAAHSNILP
jgi:hypothetical protein